MTSVETKPPIVRYRLRARGFLNAVSARREFEGALVKAGEGYGCIHPWPELGDPPLEKCLADLQGPRRWPIVRRALRCAEFDGAARLLGESLFEEMEVPDSHATLARGEGAELAAALEAGFTAVKLKCGRDPAAEAARLDRWAEEFPRFKWRLDFNEALAPEQALEFLSSLAPRTRAAIDFVEDPCPYAEGPWRELRRATGLALAVDRESGPHRDAAQVLVVKPALDEPQPLAEAALAAGQRLVLTSAMDHPLGQAFAAWEAARMGLMFPGLVGLCGLQTHHLFQDDDFTAQLGPWRPAFQPPGGTGLGFDDALDALPWTRLY